MTLPESKQKTLVDTLREMLPHFQASMSRTDVDAKWIVSSFIDAARKNPDLKKCSPQSVVLCVMQACELGLSLAPALGHAYPVPFNNKKTGQKEVVLIVGYKGFAHMLQDEKYGRKVVDIRPVSVWKNEPFEVVNGQILHKELPPSARGDSRKAAYVELTLPDGVKVTHYMWMEDILRHKARSRAAGEGPWVTDPEIMEQKTVLRDKIKWMGLGAAITKAATVDEYNEAGVNLSMLDEPEEQKKLEYTVKERPPEEPPPPNPTDPGTSTPPSSEPIVTPPPQTEPQEFKTASPAQLAAMAKLLERLGYKTDEGRVTIINNLHKDMLKRQITKLDELTFDEAVEVLRDLQTRTKQGG